MGGPQTAQVFLLSVGCWLSGAHVLLWKSVAVSAPSARRLLSAPEAHSRSGCPPSLASPASAGRLPAPPPQQALLPSPIATFHSPLKCRLLILAHFSKWLHSNSVLSPAGHLGNARLGRIPPQHTLPSFPTVSRGARPQLIQPSTQFKAWHRAGVSNEGGAAGVAILPASWKTCLAPCPSPA